MEPATRHLGHSGWSLPSRGAVDWGMLARVAVSVILIVWISTRQADLAGVLRTLKGAHAGFIILGFALFLAGEVLTTIKWRLLLLAMGTRCALRDLLRAMLIGEFYSMFLPTSVGGDIARIALTRSAAGSTSAAASAAIMQRNTGMGGLLVLALAATSLANVRLGVFRGPLALLDEVRTWYALVALAYAAINVILLSERARGVVWGRLRRHSRRGGLLSRLIRFGDSFHGTTAEMRRMFPLALAISVATQFLDCVMAWGAARAIGAPMTLAQACVFVPAASLTALLPLSVNGIGIRELTYVTLTRTAGLAPEQAVAISTIHFACLVGLALIGGLWQFFEPTRVAGTHCPHAGAASDADAQGH
jgi:uncharacterized protein (TIRG00374 family)